MEVFRNTEGVVSMAIMLVSDASAYMTVRLATSMVDASVAVRLRGMTRITKAD